MVISDQVVLKVSAAYGIHSSRAEIRQILEAFDRLVISKPETQEDIRSDEVYVVAIEDYSEEDEFNTKAEMLEYLIAKAEERNWDECDIESYVRVYIRRRGDCCLKVKVPRLIIELA
jgi:hypothetical protein